MLPATDRATRSNSGRLYRLPLAALFVLLMLLRASAPAVDDNAVAWCRINDGPCRTAVQNLIVSLDITPRPVMTMRELSFTVSLLTTAQAPVDAAVSVDLTMPGMVMGRNTIILKSRSAGRYEGMGVIVRCPSGEKLWRATIDIRRAGRTVSVPFLFEVE
ncbi:MAG: hypothetical protein OEW15_16450 [Nitrospirota bacterium]|nr:hypothetical protein [Nitrospirota bacterium]